MATELFAPPTPPTPFVGRVRELDWLRREVNNRELVRTRPIIVLGPAGIGKTSLVAKFLVPGPAVSLSFTIGTANTSPSVSRGPIWISAREFVSEARNVSSAIRRWTDERREPWATVILDAAEALAPEQQREAFSRLFNFKLVRTVIVTSRREVEFGLRSERTLHLDGLPTDEAESLLLEASHSAITPESMKKMLGVADGLPLALKLLAALAKSRNQEELQQFLAGHLYDLSQAATVPSGTLLAVARPVIISANEAMIAALKKQPKGIYKLTPRQYEELVAELFRDMGYEVKLTKATRDGGKDILAAIKTEIGKLLCLIEAKRFREDRKVGVTLVRTLYGTLLRPSGHQRNDGDNLIVFQGCSRPAAEASVPAFVEGLWACGGLDSAVWHEQERTKDLMRVPTAGRRFEERLEGRKSDHIMSGSEARHLVALYWCTMGQTLRRYIRNACDWVEPHAGKLSVVAIVISVSFGVYWWFHVPAPGKAVALLGVVAVFLALRGEISTIHTIERVLWSGIVFGLLIVEIKAIDHDRSVNQIEQSAARAEERKRFEALITRLESAITEITGGRSFCYMEIVPWGPGEVRFALTGGGYTPLSDVHVEILDLEVFHEMAKTGLSEAKMPLYRTTFDFPSATHYGGLLKFLYTLRFDDVIAAKSYNVFMRARNGNFTELLRLQRVKNRWISAKRVSASYWDKTVGLVLDEVGEGFPAEALASDKDWHGMDELKHLSIQ